MTELENPDKFLKGLFAKENNITKIILLEEGAYHDKEFPDKTNPNGPKIKKRVFDVQVQCNDTKKSVKTYSPNDTSIKKLIELGHGDTKNLIGKELPIITSFSNGNWIIYVDPTYHLPTQQQIGSDNHDTST